MRRRGRWPRVVSPIARHVYVQDLAIPPLSLTYWAHKAWVPPVINLPHSRSGEPEEKPRREGDNSEQRERRGEKRASASP
jgi:hypothetical protein